MKLLAPLKKLLERYPAGERDFNGANLTDSDLTGVNLSRST
ncbi:MAG TPA: pentapeptide repeat-containing protein [Nostoc sp.]|nr:pentapeptide repeat-containing protein [Nostoc sp.]HYX14019.1 pentapeptide repeat-containing protein [Nostoc sp.]